LLALYQYEGVFDDGEVTLHFESYDSSKTFEIRPDVNKFDLKLKQGGKEVDTYGNGYHD
jgi:hypothetical protein